MSDPDTGELAEQFTRSLLRLPRESLLSNWAPDPHVDIAPILGQVKAPTLVLHGANARRVSVHGHREQFCEVLRRFVRA